VVRVVGRPVRAAIPEFPGWASFWFRSRTVTPVAGRHKGKADVLGTACIGLSQPFEMDTYTVEGAGILGFVMLVIPSYSYVTNKNFRCDGSS